MSKRRGRILLVEDSPADQILIKRAFEDNKMLCDLYIANNGQQALQMLRHQDQDKALEGMLPDLIMMDINMPVMNGKEALQQIRQDEDLRHLPVVMLTTSSRDSDVIDSYKLGVNAYLMKPPEYSDFMDVIRQLDVFWFDMVLLPTNRDF